MPTHHTTFRSSRFPAPHAKPASRPRGVRGGLQAGFTLIELLVVVTLVAILAMIAWPSYTGYIAKQRTSGGQADLVALALNMETFRLNNSTYPAATSVQSQIETALPGWTPTQRSDFSYAITAVNNAVVPPTYSVQATGTSALVRGCTVTLSSAGARTLSGCRSGAATW